MKMLEKILFATDFGKSSQAALQRALILAKKFNSQIFLLHVIPESQLPELAMNMVKENASNELNKLSRPLKSAGFNISDVIIKTGTPFNVIIQQADLFDVNVIIIGAGDKTTADRYRLGQTAEKVTRKSDKPVWISRIGENSSVSKILCPVDFSESSKRALKNAIHLARQFEAELTVFHIIDTLTGFYQKIYKKNSELQKSFSQEHENRFEQLLKEFDFYNVKWSKKIKRGNAAEEIIKAVQKNNYNLLTLGSVGSTKNSRILIGHVAEKVIREVICPVVTFKSQDAISIRLEENLNDLQTLFEQANKLLKNGFTEEALNKYLSCVNIDMFFAPAWEGLAKVCERMDNLKEAEKYRQRAKDIRTKLWEKRIEAEIRSQHTLLGQKKSHT